MSSPIVSSGPPPSGDYTPNKPQTIAANPVVAIERIRDACRAAPAPGFHGSGTSPEASVRLINDSMQAWATGMRFEIDPETKRVVVSLIDNHSGKVLRTIPTEAVIRVARAIVRLQNSAVDTCA